MNRPTSLFLLAVTLATASAQQRLLQPADLPARAQVAERLQTALRASTADRDILAAVTRALPALPEGAAATARLASALQANHEERRAIVGDLVADLQFKPLQQAELPAGFPGFQAVDELELREYPAYRMVRTAMKGGSYAAFWPLFRHIERNSIAMTTPVQMDWQANGTSDKPTAMAFLYGSPTLGQTGTDDRVEVVDVPALTVISVGAVGDDRRDRVAVLHERLRAWLRLNPEWELAGDLRTMGYNSPMVARDQRYFEVQLPIRKAVRRQPIPV
ncbi:MAG: heme-binding protein [Planctomycetes bacterium]|nr:heme-binding protein [Planctomycetota bacterium]